MRLAICVALAAVLTDQAAAEQRRAVPPSDVVAIVRVVLQSKLPKAEAPAHQRTAFTYFVDVEGRNNVEVLNELRERYPSWLSAQAALGATFKPHAEMGTNAERCAVDRALNQPGMGIGIGPLQVVGAGRIKVDVGYYMCPHMSGEDTYELVKERAEWRIVATRAKRRT